VKLVLFSSVVGTVSHAVKLVLLAGSPIEVFQPVIRTDAVSM
jgi:hypothetical protein